MSSKSNENNTSGKKKDKIKDLLDEVNDKKIDELKALLETQNYGDFYQGIKDLKHTKNKENNLEQITKMYEENTKNKIKQGTEKYTKLNDMYLLKKEIKILKKDVHLESSKENALKKKIKEELYNKNDTKDYNDLYKIITGTHIVIFLLVIIACFFTIINNVIISTIVVFMYILIASIILIKFKKDEYRDVKDYNTFNIIKKDNKVCKIKRKN